MPISFALPGLFDFSTGRTSAINQRLLGAQADSAQSNAFIDQLNAFNTGLNTNDNLELRQGFAEQPQGTSILDRLGAAAANASSPFAANQAILQQQALAPLLAQSALQNPAFGQAQGLPGTAQGALQQGFLGINPIFQQQFNQQLPGLLQTNNPGIDASSLLAQVSAQLALAQQNNQQSGILEQNQRLQQENTELQKAFIGRLGVSNSPANTAANSGGAVNNLALVGGTGDFIQSSLPTSRLGVQR